MDAEPTILGEPPDDSVEIDVSDIVDETDLDAPRFTLREYNSACAAIRRRVEGKFKARIAELEAELAKRPDPLPEDARAMTLEDLDREMSAGEYERLVASTIRRKLRDWLAADRRIQGAK